MGKKRDNPHGNKKKGKVRSYKSRSLVGWVGGEGKVLILLFLFSTSESHSSDEREEVERMFEV